MDILMNVEAITSDCNLKDLRRLYDHTESHVRSLKLLGIVLWSPPIMSLIVKATTHPQPAPL